MTSPSRPLMTCAEFEALLADYLEQHSLGTPARAAADAHVASCAKCAALVNDLRMISERARTLAPLTPTRDLWSGIEARIEAPVVALPTAAGAAPAPVVTDVALPAASGVARTTVARRPVPSWRRLAIAASLLVTVTATATYLVTARNAAGASSLAARTVDALTPDRRLPDAPPLDARLLPASHPTATETFDREIAALRALVDARRNDLDPVTVGIVEKNLRLIDQAIAESKTALATDPANAFLSDRLTHAYDTKLQLLREIATRAPRS